MVELSHQGKIYSQIASDKTKGFIKDEYVKASNDWMAANGARINFRGTGHPDRRIPDFFIPVMEEMAKNNINYTPATGYPEERLAIARYTTMMNLPSEVWGGLKDKFANATDYKAVKQALYDVLDGKTDLVSKDLIYTPANVNTTQNGTASFSAIMKVTLNKDDKAIFIAPYYNAYDTAIRPTEAGTILVESKAENNFVPEKGSIFNSYKNNQSAKLIFLPSSNPTGATLSYKDASSFADEVVEIVKDAKINGRKINIVADVVYNEISNGEDTPIYKVLKERASKGDKDAKDAMDTFAQIISYSKIGQGASLAGAVVTKDETLRGAIEGTVIADNLATNPLGSRMLRELLTRIVDNKAALIMTGRDAEREGLVADAGKSYGKERDYLNKGWDAIANAYGVIDINKGESLLPHTSEKALYSFPQVVKLFGATKLPDDVTVFGNINLRDFVLDNPNKDRITNGIEASRLLYAMAGKEDVKVGVQGRPGEWFGYDQAARFNVTGKRAEHTEALQVVNAALKMLGLEQVRELPKGYENLALNVKPKTEVLDLFSQDFVKSMANDRMQVA